ncbi:MAG: SbcC/MukB-like Walker B domain-containing protein, partial [Micromonosporaceae bacterium]
LEHHRERDRLAGEVAELAEAIGAAETEHAAAETAATDSETAVAEAEAAVTHAQTADLAAGVRTHLVAGQPCPVCLHPVGALPDIPAAHSVAEARAALSTARQHRAKTDRAVRDLERHLAEARAHHERVTARRDELETALADHDAPEAITATLREIDALTARAEQATAAVRRTRQAHRTAATAAERTGAALREAWRELDRTRDGLAGLAPPPVDRDDLATAWRQLADWAGRTAGERTDARGAQRARVADAERASSTLRERLAGMFTDAGLPPPGDDEARYAAVAVERAEGELRRLTERREQAAGLATQRDQHAAQALLAKSLANHLRATNFERWLLEEALDLLVDGASEILRQLTAGQYDLVHDKGEFAVVDHHDADLRRAVRTLSGGETFQASLALALALSEQLAGMSTAAASLESIVLDEGFGTLDAGTLDTVAATLENLAARGDRMVGVVTHVPALAERIPVRYEVTKDARTARVERVAS